MTVAIEMGRTTAGAPAALDLEELLATRLLVQEALHGGAGKDDLAALIKDLPIRLVAPKSLDRAISTAGGVAWDEVDDRLMLHRRPGVFVAGEMLDWEAPTGGYLLQACLSTGAAAGAGVLGWLREGRAWPT